MTLAQRLAAGETVFTGWSVVPDALTLEVLSSTAFDALTLDMQHGGHNEDSVLRGLAPVIGAGMGAIVRIPVGRFDMASRALDFGAEAVIAPMINTIEDARAFAAAVKYPPVGTRSWGPTYAMPRRKASDMGAWLAGGNRQSLAFAMIETREALDILDDILAVSGIDGVFVGPSDFSIAWTGGARIDQTLEDMMAAIADIAARTVAAGKHAAIFSADPSYVARYRDMGYRLFAFGNEMRYITLGVNQMLEAARKSAG